MKSKSGLLSLAVTTFALQTTNAFNPLLDLLSPSPPRPHRAGYLAGNLDRRRLAVASRPRPGGANRRNDVHGGGHQGHSGDDDEFLAQVLDELSRDSLSASVDPLEEMFAAIELEEQRKRKQNTKRQPLGSSKAVESKQDILISAAPVRPQSTPSAALYAPMAILGGLASLLWGNEVWKKQEAREEELAETVDLGLINHQSLIQDVESDLEKLAEDMNAMEEDDQCTVPNDWTVSPSNPNKYYKMFPTNSLFADGMLGCIQLGGRLGTFKDNDELKTLKRLVRQNPNTWIGLFNPAMVKCSSEAACSGKVFWADGEVYIDEKLDDLTSLSFGNEYFSATYNTQSSTQKRVLNYEGDIDNVFPYICEINCDIGDIYLGDGE